MGNPQPEPPPSCRGGLHPRYWSCCPLPARASCPRLCSPCGGRFTRGSDVTLLLSATPSLGLPWSIPPGGVPGLLLCLTEGRDGPQCHALWNVPKPSWKRFLTWSKVPDAASPQTQNESKPKSMTAPSKSGQGWKSMNSEAEPQETRPAGRKRASQGDPVWGCAPYYAWGFCYPKLMSTKPTWWRCFVKTLHILLSWLHFFGGENYLKNPIHPKTEVEEAKVQYRLQQVGRMAELPPFSTSKIERNAKGTMETHSKRKGRH